MRPIAECSPGEPREVPTGAHPAVLRGLVADWPAVAAAQQGVATLGTYLARFDNGCEIDAIRMPPSAHGRIFYNADMSGFNFTREKMAVGAVLDRAQKNARFENGAALAAQSAAIPDCLPGFTAENPMPLLDASVVPRIWLGNAVVTPAHFDESSNIACVVAGRRRFTLFPLEQIANLYIGPLGHAPTGTPISLVSFREPNFERFPRFREALEHAETADLGPGDAIYIPPLWWHHVESLNRVNMLVNYWWKGAPGEPAQLATALDSLLHAILDLRELPEAQRRSWATVFQHYVFGDPDAASSHIPEAQRGVLGNMSPEYRKSVREFLREQLKK